MAFSGLDARQVVGSDNLLVDSSLVSLNEGFKNEAHLSSDKEWEVDERGEELE